MSPEALTAKPQLFGLTETALKAIQEVLAAYPEVEEAILYGSRALGRHRPASDIDLTLVGPALSSGILARIDADLDDLLLPWIVDLSCLSSINHQALLDHIARVGASALSPQPCSPGLTNHCSGPRAPGGLGSLAPRNPHSPPDPPGRRG